MLSPPTTKLGQGYIFTGVCDSVHRGNAWLLGGMRGIWRDTVNEWVVRILLECILVCFTFATVTQWGFSDMDKELSVFREPDKSLKHEFESTHVLSPHMSCWHCGSILIFKTRGGRFELFCCNDNYFCLEFSKNI